jgi:hypothetical protein
MLSMGMGDTCPHTERGRLAQLKDSFSLAIGGAATMEILGRSSATTGTYRIFLF